MTGEELALTINATSGLIRIRGVAFPEEETG